MAASSSTTNSQDRLAIGGASAADLPFNPDLRIPPLQNILPLVSPSHRPSPLEPNAATVQADATVRLPSRSLPLDDSAASSSTEAETPRGSGSASRKKPKVDVFHLPNPQADPADGRPATFRQLPVLNALHEPPPSAGLFPPITPSMMEGSMLDSFPPDASGSQSALSTGSSSPTATSPTLGSGPGPKAKAKRQCLRGRLKWTDSETNDLLQGVSMYGVGKWKKILGHPGFTFHPDRTMVDLKDRYRTCRMNEEKARERARFDGTPGSAGPDTASQPSSNSPESSMRKAPVDIAPKPGVEPVFAVTTQSGYKESLQSPKRKGSGIHPWSSEEDANLSRGYHRYGFQWTAIAKDGEFNLGHRTGAQVRDRFRMKYPDIYSSSVPLPLPGSSLPAPNVQRKSLPTKGKEQAGAELPPQLQQQQQQKQKEQQQRQQQQQTRLTFIAHDGKRSWKEPSALPLLRPAPPRNSKGAAASTSPPTPAGVLPDRFSGLNVHQGSGEPELVGPEASSGAASPQTSLDVDNSEQQSAADPEEVRHLSILGLLNDDDAAAHHARLPPFRYPYDIDWDPPPGPAAVTLPPLSSWDDNQKSLFDFD